MSQDYLARIAELEAKLILIAETESFLRSALARAEEKIENEEREIEHLRAQIEKLLSGMLQRYGVHQRSQRGAA
ncbi:hypothetical protein EC840_1294 [Rahnella sp. JUb53]|nr:hypothetical protein EC840_1294 [Rahnella sp. JUb53]